VSPVDAVRPGDSREKRGVTAGTETVRCGRGPWQWPIGRFTGLIAILTILIGGFIVEVHRERTLRIAIQEADVAESKADWTKITARKSEAEAKQARLTVDVVKISNKELEDQIQVAAALDPAEFSDDKNAYERLKSEREDLLDRVGELSSRLEPEKFNRETRQGRLERSAAAHERAKARKAWADKMHREKIRSPEKSESGGALAPKE
jgi:hypothetical protein